MGSHFSFVDLLKAEAYEEAGPENFDLAFRHYMKSVNERRNASWFRVRLYFRLAKLEFQMGNYIPSGDHLDKAFRLCRNYLKLKDHRMFTYLNEKLEFEMEHIHYMADIYSLYFQLDTVFHDQKEALGHYILASHWKDSVHDDQSRKQWAMMQGQYETEKAENKITRLESENELKDLRIKNSRNLLYGLGGFVLVIVLMALLFVRQNKIRAESKTVLIEQKMLRLQMNPHFIFNALSNIMNFIEKKQEVKAIQYLSNFSSLLRSTLETTRKDEILLAEENQGLVNYLELQKLRYENIFDYRIEMDERLDPEEVTIPPMLIQPFIENAIEHGIRHKRTKGHIVVRFILRDNRIICEVEDDGVGREKAWETELKYRAGRKSLATEIIQDRIDNINKRVKSKIRLSIIDLKSETNQALGTLVRLELPYLIER
jgi:hypothetical protein